MDMCITCVPEIHKGQMRTSDPQKLELQIFLGHHVGAENQNPVLCKSSQCP